MTGIPVLINTSFNLHEEPIVNSPNDAIRAYLQGNLDCLVLNNILIENKNQKLFIKIDSLRELAQAFIEVFFCERVIKKNSDIHLLQ